MRLFHKEHGYHFVADTNEIAELKAIGWMEAPKGYQKVLKEISAISKDVVTKPRRGRPRAK